MFEAVGFLLSVFFGDPVFHASSGMISFPRESAG
jgi:hypothetical protein